MGAAKNRIELDAGTVQIGFEGLEGGSHDDSRGEIIPRADSRRIEGVFVSIDSCKGDYEALCVIFYAGKIETLYE